MPGKFIKTLPNDVIPNPDSNLRMDIVELAGADGKTLDKEIVINIEHQSTKLNHEKMETIWGYKNYALCKHKYPVLSVVVSPYPREAQQHVYKSTESEILAPLMICIDEGILKKD